MFQASFAGEGLAARLFAAVDFRDSGTVSPKQFCDVGFHELMKDPMAVIASVYEWLELPLNAEVEGAMRGYLAAKPRGRDGRHDYSFADLGLELARERARFSEYQERFGVPSEVA